MGRKNKKRCKKCNLHFRFTKPSVKKRNPSLCPSCFSPLSGTESYISHVAPTLALSKSLSRRTLQYLQEKLQNLPSNPSDPNWGDQIFEPIWREITNGGKSWNTDKDEYSKIFAFSHTIESINNEIYNAPWENIHKGLHYYNVGLSEYLRMETDRAFKFFWLGDTEDETRKSTAAGDLLRKENIYERLRKGFFEKWLTRTNSFDTNIPASESYELLKKVMRALPGRPVIFRCNTGMTRACFLDERKREGLPIVPLTRFLIIEELGVFTEAVARMRFENTLTPTNTNTLGGSFSGDKLPSYNLTRENNFNLSSQEGTIKAIDKASCYEKEYVARVVQIFRNLSAHASDFPEWLQRDKETLDKVINIQLRFILTLAQELQTAEGMEEPIPPPVPRKTLDIEPSGSMSPTLINGSDINPPSYYEQKNSFLFEDN